MTVAHVCYDGKIEATNTDPGIKEEPFNTDTPEFRDLFLLGTLCNKAIFLPDQASAV